MVINKNIKHEPETKPHSTKNCKNKLCGWETGTLLCSNWAGPIPNSKLSFRYSVDCKISSVRPELSFLAKLGLACKSPTVIFRNIPNIKQIIKNIVAFFNGCRIFGKIIIKNNTVIINDNNEPLPPENMNTVQSENKVKNNKKMIFVDEINTFDCSNPISKNKIGRAVSANIRGLLN